MATGANLQPRRGAGVSNITPGADLRTGDAEMWETARRTADRLYDEGIKPNLIARAQARGMTEGAEIAAGEREYSRPAFQFGDVAAARQQALETAFDARIKSDIDAREDELRRQHRLDPEAYERASQEMVSGFIQGAPPEFAVAVETYARTRTARGLSVVADARSLRDEQEATQALGVRIASLDERMIALASRGERDSEEYREALLERADLQTQRANNPAILYSEDQRVLDDDKLDDAVLGADVSRLAANTYRDAGRGLAGLAAGMRFLNDEILEGEAFKDVDPERRQRIYRDAAAQLRDVSAVDREETRAQAEEERARRAEQREKVGDLRLSILMGEVSEADILARSDIDEAQKAGLVSAARAQVRRERTESRAIAAAETAGRRDVYNGFRDDAQAGTLTSAEIADAVNAGTLTRGQAQTLRTLNDRSLKPVIDDVLAPVRDEARRPGRSLRGGAQAMAIAEQAATEFVRTHPDLTLEQRLAGGRAIAERVFGGQSQGRPANQQAAQSDQSARLSALSAERQRRQQQGRAMSQAEYNRRRNEIMHGTGN